jgi:hypothetical protein
MIEKVHIRIRYDRRLGPSALLTTVLLVAILFGYLLWRPVQVVANLQTAGVAQSLQSTAATTALMRGYYLTKAFYTGDIPSYACADGYHMASLWEIIDPSNLDYNTDLGYTTPDSGQGPPTWLSTAWMRTGYDSTGDVTDAAGQANCNAWSSAGASDWGTYVYLNDQWDVEVDVSVWRATTGLCTNELRVWCVVDRVGFDVFIPLVLRSFM